MPTPVSDLYAALVRDKIVERDAAQAIVLRLLDQLSEELAEYRLKRKSSSLGWLFSKKPAPPPDGIYIWGGVGRGKTLLMDLFFEASPIRRKRRVHFHAFMADVHARIHRLRQEPKGGDDPIAMVADALADETRLLCFDEFNVTDITDAMILGRLFTALFANGVIMVATSNVEPSNLYANGLNRDLFLPFISLLQQRMKVAQLDARTDFRLEKLSGAAVYYTPADGAARDALTEAFRKLTGKAEGQAATLEVLGRDVRIQQSRRGVARFEFADLCAKALGSVDYLEIARHYHTILIDGVPVMGPAQRNEARRFIWLIDALYDAHVKVILSAQAQPDQLFTVPDSRESFEFARTASRLIEMQSQQYLALPRAGGEPPPEPYFGA